MIHRVRYTEILESPNAAALLREYSAECSLPEIGQTHPQRQMYEAMEATGLMQTFGSYEGNELVGFATILIYVLPHYGRQIATVESLFVAKKYRVGSTGRELMKNIEEYAREKKCKVILYSAPTGSRLERLLNALRPYRRTNSIFLRSLA